MKLFRLGWIKLVVLLLDMLVVYGSYLLAYKWKFSGRIPADEWQSFMDYAPWLGLCTLVTYYFFNLYDFAGRRRPALLLYNLVLAHTVFVAELIVINYWLKTFSLPRTVVAGAFMAQLLLTFGLRLLLFYIQTKGSGRKKALVLISGQPSDRQMLQKLLLKGEPWLEIRQVAVAAGTEAEASPSPNGAPASGPVPHAAASSDAAPTAGVGLGASPGIVSVAGTGNDASIDAAPASGVGTEASPGPASGPDPHAAAGFSPASDPGAYAAASSGSATDSATAPVAGAGIASDPESAAGPASDPKAKAFPGVSPQPDRVHWADIDVLLLGQGIPDEVKTEWIRLAGEHKLEVLLIPDFYELYSMNAEFQQIDDLLVCSIMPPHLTIPERFAKRALDIALSLVLLLAASPLMAAAFILVPATSKGKALYAQERVGRDGRLFKLYKFRSMVDQAEAATGPVLAADGDQRITGLGRIMRATRIDELPQLFNILTGTMSLVGPRPERAFFIERFKEELPCYTYRLMVKPGLTGLAQVMAGYTTSAADKLRYDLMYMQNYSLLLDLKILFQTLLVVFNRDQARGVAAAANAALLQRVDLLMNGGRPEVLAGQE